jgi:FixJ family two-component response regulator
MNTSTIAIVDDNHPVREALEGLVRSLGYRASTFASANEFLDSKQLSFTSCLITDMHMPGLSGLELQDRLIAKGQHIPIIFITAYPDETVRKRAIKAGAVGFLSKPVRPDHLLEYLEKARGPFTDQHVFSGRT